MHVFFNKIKTLVTEKKIRISEHGYDEMAADDIYLSDIINAMEKAVVVEDYPDYPKGSCVLVLLNDSQGLPIHAVWGIPKGCDSPAVLVTAYRPDSEKWDHHFKQRKKL